MAKGFVASVLEAWAGRDPDHRLSKNGKTVGQPNQVMFAQALRITPRTLRGWLSGDSCPSAMAMELLRRLKEED